MALFDRVKQLCISKGTSLSKMEKEIGISSGASYKWKNSSPSMEVLEKMSRYFGVSVDYILTGNESNTDTPYYLNDDAREMAQFMFENPEYKVLFDASRKISKEDIETVKAIMDKFRRPDAD